MLSLLYIYYSLHQKDNGLKKISENENGDNKLNEDIEQYLYQIDDLKKELNGLNK